MRLAWFRTKDIIYGHQLDFGKHIDVYVCSACNSELIRKTKKGQREKENNVALLEIRG